MADNEGELKHEEFEYDAFVSYSWECDKQLAAYLVQRVHAFARPWNRRATLRLYIDVEGLAEAEAWPGIQKALSASRRLILLASQAAARSPSVQRELDCWRTLGRPSPIVILTDGEVRWSAEAGTFDWSKTTALPIPVSDLFKGEPTRLDVRTCRNALSPRNSQLQYVVAVVYASLTEEKLEDVIGEDVRVHRRNVAFAATAVGLVVVATLVTGYFIEQERFQQRVVAAHKLKAESDLLGLVRRDQIDASASAAAEAVVEFQALDVRSIEAEQALRDRAALVVRPANFGKTTFRPYVMTSDLVTRSVYVGTESEQGCTIDAVDPKKCSGELCRVDVPLATLTCTDTAFPVRVVEPGGDKGLLAWAGENRLCLGRQDSGSTVETLGCSVMPSSVLQVRARGGTAFAVAAKGHVCLVEASSPAKEPMCLALPAEPQSAFLSPSGGSATTLSEAGLCVFELTDWPLQLPNGRCSPASGLTRIVAVDDGGRWTLGVAEPRGLRRVEADGATLWSVTLPAPVRQVNVALPSGLVAAVARDFRSMENRVTVLDLKTGEALSSLSHQGRLSGASFSPDGTMVLTHSGLYFPGDKTASVWNARTGQELRRLVHDGDIAVGAFSSADGTQVSTATDTGSVAGWMVRRPDVVGLNDLNERVRHAVTSARGDVALAGSDRACLRSAATGKQDCWPVNDPIALSLPFGGTLAYLTKKKLCTIASGASQQVCLSLSGSTRAALSEGEPVLATAEDGRLCVSRFAAASKVDQAWCSPIGRAAEVFAVSANGRAVAVQGDTVDSRHIYVENNGSQPLVKIPRPYQGILSETFSRSGDYYAHTNDGVPYGSIVQVVSLRSGKTVWVRKFPGRVVSLAFSPDGRYLSTGAGSGGQGDAHIWDWERDIEVARMPHRRPVTAVAFSDDGDTVFSASNEGNEVNAEWRQLPFSPSALLRLACGSLRPSTVSGAPASQLAQARSKLASRCAEVGS